MRIKWKRGVDPSVVVVVDAYCVIIGLFTLQCNTSDSYLFENCAKLNFTYPQTGKNS